MATKKEKVETLETIAEQIETPAEKISFMEYTEAEKRFMFYQKKKELRQKLLSYPFVVDGYNQAQKYEYVKAEQYRNALSKTCLEVGLDYHLSGVNCIYENMVKSDKMAMTTVIYDIHLLDPDTGFEEVTRQFAQGADNLDKGMYKADTMVLKEYVRNEFGIIDNDKSADCEAAIVEEVARFVTPEKKAEMVKEIVAKPEEVKPAGEPTNEFYVKEMLTVMDDIRLVYPDWGTATYNTLKECLATGNYISQLEATNKMNAITKKYEKELPEITKIKGE